MHALRLSALALTVALIGCGVSETEITDTGAPSLEEGSGELSATSRTYVTAQRDFRKCSSPMCGGWFVQDVNRVNPNPQYVTALDYSASGLTAEQLEQTSSNQGDLVLYGKLGKVESNGFRKFLVTSAWRGLPGVTAAAGEQFFRIEQDPKSCFAAPCAQLTGIRLHSAAKIPTHGVELKRALLTRVDGNWLTNRVELHGALVVGKYVDGQKFSTGTERILSGSQVFVKIPEAAGPCPQFKLAACPNGKTRSYVRDAERCIIPSACVSGGACALFVPQCAEGYVLQSWTGGQFACQVYACDPAWSVPAQQN